MRLLAALGNIVVAATVTGVLAWLVTSRNPDVDLSTVGYAIFAVVFFGLLFIGFRLSERVLQGKTKR